MIHKLLIESYCNEVCQPARKEQCNHCHIDGLDRFAAAILIDGKSMEEAIEREKINQRRYWKPDNDVVEVMELATR